MARLPSLNGPQCAPHGPLFAPVRAVKLALWWGLNSGKKDG